MQLRRIFPALGVVLAAAALVPPAARASGPDPAAVLEELRAARPNAARAVALEGVELDTGLARFVVEQGTLFPTAAIGQGAVEMVFLGRGRLVLEPPDEIEAGQLDLFTGRRRLDERVSAAVFVVGDDAAVASLLARPAAAPDEALAARAAEIFDTWRASPERRALDVEMALLLDALGEPAYDAYFAAWLRGEALGDFLYAVEPGSAEQVTLGRFEPFELTEKEERRVERQLHRQQRRGRLIGLRVEDLGIWDTWLSAPRTGAGGEPILETAPFEPERYVLDLALDGRKLDLAATARVELRAVTGGSRAVFFNLDPELRVEAVRDDAGGELFFLQDLSTLLVLLPETLDPGAATRVEIDYGGPILEKLDTKSFVLRTTTSWYPHTGTVDLARYDVTLRWPRHLDLVAAGRRVDGGKAPGGDEWERRVVDRPTFGYSFEVGRYRTRVTGKAGHVDVTLHVDFLSEPLVRGSQDDLLEAVTDALGYFEKVFGPYPLDDLTVVTAPRFFSQSLLGFVTLSTPMMAGWLGFEDFRTVIAHEIAHQWWGHEVGWESYRDVWISEALANYAALLYTRNRLGLDPGWGPTAGWQRALTRTTDDGRPLESVGPVVLGSRLASSRAPWAFEPIVYRKGAVVLDMLARTWGEERFVRILRAIVRAAGGRALSTEGFLDLIEHVTGHDVDLFAEQFIYGTGLPEVYYRYDFEEAPDGAWVVTGEARQEAPYHYRYRVVERPGGTLDVEREALQQMEVAGSTLIVPVHIAVHDPAREGGREAGNAMLGGHTVLTGERTELRFEVPLRPTELWLDREAEVFGRFFNERRHPKRVLFFKGLDHAAAGRHEAAETVLRRALEAPVFDGPAWGEAVKERERRERERLLDRRIHLALARLLLAAERDGEAPPALERSERLARKADPGWLEEDLRVLRARLALRRGRPEEAHDLLRKKLLRDRIRDTEGLAVLAIAARAVGDAEEYREALEALEGSGVDLTALASRDPDS